MSGNEATLLGRQTYDEFAADWPNADPADPITGAMNGARRYVVSTTTLVRWMLEQGLVDELHLLVHPIVVGHGKKLFADGATVPLKLASSTAFDTGVLHLVYTAAPVSIDRSTSAAGAGRPK